MPNLNQLCCCAACCSPFNSKALTNLHRARNFAHANNPRFPRVVREFYPELSLLLNHFNETYQRWVFWIDTIVAVGTVLSSAAAFLYFYPRGIITAIISFPLLMYLVRTSGAVYDESAECLKYWRKVEYKGTTVRLADRSGSDSGTSFTLTRV